MWKLCIIDNDQGVLLFDKLAKDLNFELERLNGSVQRNKKENCIDIEIENDFVAYTKALIKEFVAEYVLNKYKIRFFEEHLKLIESYGLNGIALLKTISVLDRSEEINQIKNELEINNGSLVIDSLWLFKLSNIKNRWLEVTEIISINMADIVSTDAFLDIVRYLLKLVDKNYSIVRIIETKDDIFFVDDNYQKVTDIQISQNDSDKNAKVINTIIELSPRMLEWENHNLKEEKNIDLKKLTMSIFS